MPEEIEIHLVSERTHHAIANANDYIKKRVMHVITKSSIEKYIMRISALEDGNSPGVGTQPPCYSERNSSY